MPIPFASAYAPINTLNDAIQAQAARQQQGYLQASTLNDASVADSLNRVVQQKAMQQQAEAQRAHYGFQQQQLANDMAYRNQALAASANQERERARQFDRMATMNEMLAKAQVDRPQLPSSAITEMGRRDEFNAEAGGLTSGVNMALKTAKAKRDAALKEIDEVRKSMSPGDLWTDLWTSNGAWAKQGRMIEGAYKDEIGKIVQSALGRVTVRQAGPDEFEAVPVTLPQLNFPGMTPRVAPQSTPAPQLPVVLPDAAPFPAAYGRPVQTAQPVASSPSPVFNPYAAFSAMRQQQSRTNAPPVSAAPANRMFRYDPQAGLIPLQ